MAHFSTETAVGLCLHLLLIVEVAVHGVVIVEGGDAPRQSSQILQAPGGGAEATISLENH